MLPADVRHLDPVLADAYDAVDWSATPLGPVEGWTPALRHAFDVCLHTGYAATLLWGPDMVLVYNTAYAPLIGDKHPAALGRAARDVFPEAWDQVGPLLTGVLEDGEAVFLENSLIPLVRHGFLEDCYFSYSYSPVHDDEGRVVGVLDISAETTAQEVSVRRLQRFAELRGGLAGVDTAADVRVVLADTFGDDPDLREVSLRLPGTDTDDRLPVAPQDGALVPGRVLVEATADGPVAWLRLRTSTTGARGSASGRPAPVLVARLNPRLPVDAAYEQYLALLGTTLGQAWDRLGVLEIERQVAAAEHEVSLTLQRSLLSVPASVPGLEVAVRYDPASRHTHIGGDWYDAFLADDGELVLSVGDVAGHDLTAISMMGQVRTLLRGLAFRSADPPGAVMTLLDDVLGGLGLDSLASGLVARLAAADDDGCRTLSWSNAGHPPPVLLAPDGSTRFLEATPEPLLGLVGLADAPRRRSSHRVALAPGSTLVLYTDGLVERPGRHLDDGLTWLRQKLVGHQGLSAEDLADLVVADLPPTLGDDVAVMIVRVDDTSPRP